MSPGRTPAPPWRRVLEDHATWQDWTKALRVYWHPDGVTLRDVPAQWGPEVQTVEFRVQGREMPPPRNRLWRLVRYALGGRYRVAVVPQEHPSVLQLRITER